MGFFDWLFGKKDTIEEKVEVASYNDGIENVQITGKNIIRTKCVCGHKKARLNNHNEIVCRRCKSIIGRKAD